jgi:hypothetical protein
MGTTNLTVIPFVTGEDYPELLRIVDDKDSFPADYDSFLQLCDTMIKDYQEAGSNIIRITLNPGELAEWCRGQNKKIDGKARADYAVFLYSKSQGSETRPSGT